MLAVSTTAGLLATVTLLLSAVGGWIAGLQAVRIGRVRTLQITNLWFSLFTSLEGFAQSFEQLIVFRARLRRRVAAGAAPCLSRAVRRGLNNMRIQSLMTAAAINLKVLAAALWASFLGRPQDSRARTAGRAAGRAPGGGR